MLQCQTLVSILCFCISTYSLLGLSLQSEEEDRVEILRISGIRDLKFCENASLECEVRPIDTSVWWSFRGDNITDNDRFKVVARESGDFMISVLMMTCVTLDDIGNYSCHASPSDWNEDQVSQTIPVDITKMSQAVQVSEISTTTPPFYQEPPVENRTREDQPIQVNTVSSTHPCHSRDAIAAMERLIGADYLSDVPGQVVSTQDVRGKLGGSGNLSCAFSGYPLYQVEWQKANQTIPESRWKIVFSNTTFLQTVLPLTKLSHQDNGTYQCSVLSAQGPVTAPVHVYVLDVPHVTIEIVKVVGAHKIFLNWTVNDGNSPIKEYNIMFMKNGTNEWTFTRERVKVTNTSYVIKNLEPDTSYKVKINTANAIGQGKDYTYPDFVRTLKKDPDIVPILKFKAGGADFINVGWEVPTEDEDHVHYLELELTHNTTRLKSISIQSLATDNKNMLFGKLASATTYLIRGRACSEYTFQCGNWSEYINGTTIDGESGPPENVTVICKYDNITRSSFVHVSWAPPSQPNGKIVYYNVVLEGSAKFRNEKGVEDHVTWGPKAKNIDEKSHSARFDMVPPNTNYTVRVAGVTRSRGGGKKAEQHCQVPPTTPDREKLRSINWGKVEEHGRWMLKLFMPKVSERNGRICCFRVFVTKLKQHQSVADLPPPQDSNVLSYQEVHYSKHGGTYLADMFESDALSSDIFLGDGHTVVSPSNSTMCKKCVGLRPRPPTVPPPPTPTTTSAPPTTTTVQVLADIPSLYSPSPQRRLRSPTTPTPSPPSDIYTQLYDGQLDTNSNYTGFVEVIVFGGEQVLIPAYSSYFETLQPGPQVFHAAESSQFLTIVLEVMIVLILVVLILLVSLCLLQKYTKQVAEAQGVEISLRNSLRHLCRSLRGSHLPVSSSPPDMAPIPANQLPAAYLERRRDSDYGFQHEFELLPDGFPDRTTRASEARENLYKNRYPDIKAYDQTRVRLAQIDSIAGSDYVNANFVVGYKERKKFICAQGPMDNTVCDFWRMIWEQHLELILMLTNLEEYSKTKCAKYWADKTEGEKTYGDISISHVQEKRYSDYIIRELKMTRTSGGSKERESRSIVQYHFLVWKDFQAPEHPSGILKFIRRVNEAYSLEKGPILVHCSAGVGRTGTLVALDSLLQQLEAEGQVAIFNTVCDLRHQRNFLVQSLKQYIFVYRALQEVAQFGNTEIKASKLKCTLERLRQVENGKEKSKMEEEFEKMGQVVEEKKSHSVGGGEENSVKNRCETIIPYDRNRVILTPVPSREHSTYINASFIEGYDNSESFIITQDPIMEVTVADFWRMVSEQGISTLVMLSDLGDGPRKCPRYWPDDEIAHDHIRVKYIQSESCPYYTRRELCVTNIKTDEKQLVTQYQYNGWPTVEGEVPEVTRGLIELVDQTQATAGGSAVLVHCHCGSDRSSMFVALSILVQQLRTERRVDICTTVRKLRAQRQGMIQTFAQYEFLHRAIANYADLHQLTTDDVD